MTEEQIEQKAQEYIAEHPNRNSWVYPDIDIEDVTDGYIAGYKQALADMEEAKQAHTKKLEALSKDIDTLLDGVTDEELRRYMDTYRDKEDKRIPGIGC